MGRGLIFRSLLIVAFLAALPLWAASDRVAPVSSESGPILWLPPGADLDDQAGALEETARFIRSWTLLFGRAPELSDPVQVPGGGSLEEALFGILWQQAAGALPPADRQAVRGALRWSVLEDPAAIMDSLAKTSASGRWDASLAEGVPLYVFLMEEATEPAFLREALPPGPKAHRLKAALSRRGASWNRFWNRYASWLLCHAVEWGFVTPASGTLPAVWMLDAPLAPGEMSAWRFPQTEYASGVSLEVSGEAVQGLRLFHVSTDDLGRVTGAGLCDLKPGTLSLPRSGKWLWLFLWNTADIEAGTGAALTLWSSYEAPFEVVGSSLKDGVLDLQLREEPGIADFRLWADPGRSPVSAPLAEFESEGQGEHSYRLLVPHEAGHGLRLSCRTLAGGAYSADLPAEEPAP